MLAFLSIYFAWKALAKSSKKTAEIFSYSSLVFATLLLISAVFDYLQIMDSKNNNYNLCNLIDEFKVEKNVDSEAMDCTYNILFYSTIVFLYYLLFLLLVSSQIMSNWAKTISKDNY